MNRIGSKHENFKYNAKANVENGKGPISRRGFSKDAPRERH